MNNSEIFNKAVSYAFALEEKTIIWDCLDEVESFVNTRGAGERSEEDQKSIESLCEAIDKAIVCNHLDWNASAKHPEVGAYQAKFHGIYKNENEERKKWFEEHRIEADIVPKSERDRCHHYTNCRLPKVCPTSCTRNHLYLNQLDHLLHYLAVQIWNGNGYISPAHIQYGLRDMKKFIENCKID